MVACSYALHERDTSPLLCNHCSFPDLHVGLQRPMQHLSNSVFRPICRHLLYRETVRCLITTGLVGKSQTYVSFRSLRSFASSALESMTATGRMSTISGSCQGNTFWPSQASALTLSRACHGLIWTCIPIWSALVRKAATWCNLNSQLLCWCLN